MEELAVSVIYYITYMMKFIYIVISIMSMQFACAVIIISIIVVSAVQLLK